MADVTPSTGGDLIRERFSGSGNEGPLYLPDLTLWHAWHQERESMPAPWQGYTLPQVARDMGVPVWMTARPWRVETPGIEEVTKQGEDKRVTRWTTERGVLTSRWSLGPDGDWWQVEYPVKTLDDLPLMRDLVAARSYVVDEDLLADKRAQVGKAGVVAIQLPQQPYSELLHAYLGWGEGLILLSDGAELVSEILDIQQSKLASLLARLDGLPGEIVLAPDNLDGNFISPPAFERYMRAGYRRTAQRVHAQEKWLVVQAGGPVRHLLPGLVEAGVDGVEGISGPPQADLTLAEARQLAGPACTLWGGIPQDWLVPTHDRSQLEGAVHRIVEEMGGDGRAMVGVADRVPVDADPERLAALPGLIEGAWTGS